MFGQEHDVVGAFAQRRQRDDVEGEAIQQVGSEAPFGDQARQVLVRGGDDAHVRAQRLPAADALELAVLDHAQELLLHQRRGGGQLVQEQRAAVGPLEAAVVGAHGAGEGTGFVAEQLAFDQRVADGRAVELRKLGIPTLGEVVQARGDEFLAGAPFADHQHRLVQRRRLGDLLQRREKGRRLADQPILFAGRWHFAARA